MKKITVVTGNKGKAQEISDILGIPVQLSDLDIPEIQSISVKEVATEKALTAYKKIGKPVLVDDSGLYLEEINGLPGAFITWFLKRIGCIGVANMVQNNRRATASVCIAFCDKNGVQTFLGEVEGFLTKQLLGKNGFGYDTIFRPKGYKKTFAEMNLSEKNKLSPRSIALEMFKKTV